MVCDHGRNSLPGENFGEPVQPQSRVRGDIKDGDRDWVSHSLPKVARFYLRAGLMPAMVNGKNWSILLNYHVGSRGESLQVAVSRVILKSGVWA